MTEKKKIDHLALPSGKITDITHGLNGPRAATTTPGENCRKRYTKKLARPARPNVKLFHSPTRIIPTWDVQHAHTQVNLTRLERGQGQVQADPPPRRRRRRRREPADLVAAAAASRVQR